MASKDELLNYRLKMGRLLEKVAFLTIVVSTSYCFIGSFRVNRNTNICGKNEVALFCMKQNSGFDIHDVPKSPISILRPELSKFMSRSLAFSGISFGLVSKSAVAEERPVVLDRICSDSVSILKSENEVGPESVILIGTAHISEESAKLVTKTITKTRPDVVMIELDVKRIGRIPNYETLRANGFDIPDVYLNAASSSPPASSFGSLKFLLGAVQGWAQQAAGAALGNALKSFYGSIQKLGFTPGAEFDAAVLAGRQVGARILLGDRDVEVTLQRLSTAISQSDLDKFDALGAKLEQIMGTENVGDIPKGLPGDKESLTALVEAVKQRKYIADIMNLFKTDLPLVYNALVGERDAFMAESIAGARGKQLVAVVGMAHMEGIERNLKEKKFRIVGGNCI